MRHYFKYFFLYLVFLASCGPDQKKEPNEENLNKIDIEVEGYTLNWEALSSRLVERMNLTSGERVLLVAKPGLFDDMIPVLANDIKAAGGEYLGALSVSENQPDNWKTEFISNAVNVDSLQLADLLKTVDLGVMMPGPVPADLPYGILQDILEEGSRRTIHFHWSGAYDLNGNALNVDDSINAFYQNVVLNTDYESLAFHQLSFEDAMRGKRIRVTTPEGTNISFEIGDRPVTRQDGDASAKRTQSARNLIDREIEIPAGAIRVAPLEETVKGQIAFPDAIWGGKQVNKLLMTFDKGKLVSTTAQNGIEGVRAELDAAVGNSGESFREFALGFNPMLAIPPKNSWIPYYGYGAGVVRLSLGDNSELGGIVTGGYVRWNFFINATVTVDGEVWVQSGKLVK